MNHMIGYHVCCYGVADSLIRNSKYHQKPTSSIKSAFDHRNPKPITHNGLFIGDNANDLPQGTI